MAEQRRPLARLLDSWRPIAAVLAGLVALNLLVHVFYIRELVRVSGDREAILSAQRARVAERAEEVRGIERTTSKFACATSDAQHVFEDVLSSKQGRMTSIQRELRELARAGRLDPTRISYTLGVVGTTGLVRFGIAFPLEGSYEQVKSFLEKIEESDNFLIIDDLTMSGDKSQGASLRLQVKLATYFLSPDIAALQAAFPGLRSTS